MQSARTRSCRWWLLRLLMAERNGLFELHLIAVCETIPWCGTADRGNYVRCLPACMKDMAALQLKQPKFYKCMVFDRYDSEISIKRLERDRCTHIERQLLHNVQTTENYIKNATNTSALAEFICVYLIETAPHIVKEHQWIMLTGGFNNDQLVKVVEHTGVIEQPEMFSAHDEADTRVLLHAIDLATTHSRLIVRCDDTDRLVFLIYYHVKCMFAKCKVYMNADVHSCQQDSIEHQIYILLCFSFLLAIMCSYNKKIGNTLGLLRRESYNLVLVSSSSLQFRLHSCFTIAAALPSWLSTTSSMEVKHLKTSARGDNHPDRKVALAR